MVLLLFSSGVGMVGAVEQKQKQKKAQPKSQELDWEDFNDFYNLSDFQMSSESERKRDKKKRIKADEKLNQQLIQLVGQIGTASDEEAQGGGKKWRNETIWWNRNAKKR